MPSAPINLTINLASNGSATIDATGYQGYSFDMNITSSTADGTISVFCQNTNPATDTFSRSAVQTYTISSGTFSNSMTSQVIDSAFLTASPYCVVEWAKESGTGTLNLVGFKRGFS